MKRNITLVVCFGLLLNTVHSQNKKEQIVALNFSIDSLKQQVDQKEQKISIQNGTISRNLLDIDSVKSISKNQKNLIDLQLLTIEEQKKANLITLSQLEILNKSIDSLNDIIFNLDNVTIGKQIWKKENLKITYFNNGDIIPEAKKPEQWEDFGNSKSPCFMHLPNGEKLYNGYVLSDIRGIVPKGYSIPTNEDYKNLINFLSSNSNTKKSAVQQMLTYNWYEDNGPIDDASEYISNNSSGFNVRPAGLVYPQGNLDGFILPEIDDDNDGKSDNEPNYKDVRSSFGSCTYYWTSTKSKPDAEDKYPYNEDTNSFFYNGIDFGYCAEEQPNREEEIVFSKYDSKFGFSIRLIKQ
jgi:uncharacterized protein (TIGR02145 family)